MAGSNAEIEDPGETPASDQTREGGARAPPGNQAMIPRLSAPCWAINRADEPPAGTTASTSSEPVEPGAGAAHRMQQSVRSCSAGAAGTDRSAFDVQIAPAMAAS